MAWTDTCKIEARNTVEKKADEVGSIRAACRVVAEESGIPASTLRHWCKYPDGKPKTGEESPETQRVGNVLPDKTVGPTPQSEVWVSVAKRLGTLEKFMRKNCTMPAEIDPELRMIIKDRLDFVKDAMGEGGSDV